MFSLPGTPVLRYGDEIGMGDDLTLKERHPVRTPMQWSSDRNAGFSTADKTRRARRRRRALSATKTSTSSAQRRDPDSLLQWMARLIRLRIECPEIGWGDWKLVATRSPHVLALLYRWRGTAVLCLHNFDGSRTRSRCGWARTRRRPRRSVGERPLARRTRRRAPDLARRLRLPLVSRRAARSPLEAQENVGGRFERPGPLRSSDGRWQAVRRSPGSIERQVGVALQAALVVGEQSSSRRSA